MLVLTRKQQEQIFIGNNIRITVLKSKGKSIRLGIEAPRDITVLRGELVFDQNQIEIELQNQDSKEEAATSDSAPVQVEMQRVKRETIQKALPILSLDLPSNLERQI